MELNIKEAENSFYQVTVAIKEETDTGKIRKTREVHLVDAKDPIEVQNKVMEAMSGTMAEWEIASITKSKILMAY